MIDLYIIGSGCFGREVAWCVERINNVTPTWNLKGFIDDNETKWKTKEDGYIVLGDCEYLKQQENAYAVCAIGNAKVRKQIIEKLSNSGVRFATIGSICHLIKESFNWRGNYYMCRYNCYSRYQYWKACDY